MAAPKRKHSPAEHIYRSIRPPKQLKFSPVVKSFNASMPPPPPRSTRQQTLTQIGFIDHISSDEETNLDYINDDGNEDKENELFEQPTRANKRQRLPDPPVLEDRKPTTRATTEKTSEADILPSSLFIKTERTSSPEPDVSPIKPSPSPSQDMSLTKQNRTYQQRRPPLREQPYTCRTQDTGFARSSLETTSRPIKLEPIYDTATHSIPDYADATAGGRSPSPQGPDSPDPAQRGSPSPAIDRTRDQDTNRGDQTTMSYSLPEISGASTRRKLVIEDSEDEPDSEGEEDIDNADPSSDTPVHYVQDDQPNSSTPRGGSREMPRDDEPESPCLAGAAHSPTQSSGRSRKRPLLERDVPPVPASQPPGMTARSDLDHFQSSPVQQKASFMPSSPPQRLSSASPSPALSSQGLPAPPSPLEPKHDAESAIPWSLATTVSAPPSQHIGSQPQKSPDRARPLASSPHLSRPQFVPVDVPFALDTAEEQHEDDWAMHRTMSQLLPDSLMDSFLPMPPPLDFDEDFAWVDS